MNESVVKPDSELVFLKCIQGYFRLHVPRGTVNNGLWNSSESAVPFLRAINQHDKLNYFETLAIKKTVAE